MSSAPATKYWRKGQLQDLVFFQRGFDITQAQQTPGPFPVISSSGVTSYHSEFKANGPGVVIGRKGTLGSVHYSEGDYWPHDTTLWSKDLRGNNPRFVYFYLHTINLKRFDVGNSNPTLNRNHIHDLPALVPPLETQQRIADILSAYDNLIENNRRRVALLEDAARQLYREWFVRLRFPGHEHVNLTDGIPAGWHKSHISDLVTTQYGYTDSATDQSDEPKLLRGTDINKASYIDWDSVPYCSNENVPYEKYALEIGDVVVIRMADPGKVAIVEADIKAVFASYLVRLKLNTTKLTSYYLFYCMNDPRYEASIKSASAKSTRSSASAPLLTDYEILVPPLPLLRSFDELVLPIRQQITKLLQQNAALRGARDLLLPRLMSGAIPV